MFTRMYAAEQIQVPPDLPAILKAFAKEVIRQNPSDLLEFGAKYFADLAASPPTSASGYRITLSELHELQEALTGVLKQQPELRRVDLQIAAEEQGINPDVIANILRLGFTDKEVVDMYLFMGIAATLVSPNWDKTVVNLFKIFEDEQCLSKIPTSSFIGFVEWVAARDASVAASAVAKLKEQASEEMIDLATYQKIFSGDVAEQ